MTIERAANRRTFAHCSRIQGSEECTAKHSRRVGVPISVLQSTGRRAPMTSSNESIEQHQQGTPHPSVDDDCWIIATDLDGTLLDRTYDLKEAARALNLVVHSWPVVHKLVLATSKTLQELEPLATMLDQPAVLVYENGAGYALASAANDQTSIHPVHLSDESKQYRAIRNVLVRLREHHEFDFTGFGDMSARQVSEITALDLESAELAKQRCASEPLLWFDTESRLELFRKALAAEGLGLVSGGQFHHVSAPVNKWDAVDQWRQRSLPHAQILACGDAHNDEQLLRAADKSLVFPRGDGSYLLPNSAAVGHAPAPGPAAWYKAVCRVLSDLTSNSTSTGARQ